MRIICPSCAAEYEVDEVAIPSEGRDVQCSNCGRAWFQLPNSPVARSPAGAQPAVAKGQGIDTAMPPPASAGSGVAGAAEERSAGAPPTAEPAAADRFETRPTAAPRPDAQAPEEEERPEGGRSEDETPEGETPADVPRPSLDEALREMLRAEAEREAAARRAETAALETQPELGLTEAVPAKAAAPASADSAADTTPAPPAAPRKRLPKIEEVDPVLDPQRPVPEGATAPDEAAARRGFRAGFLLVLAIALALLLVYLFGRMRPEPGPVLSSYVALVDDTRLILSSRLEALIQRLTELMSGAG